MMMTMMMTYSSRYAVPSSLSSYTSSSSSYILSSIYAAGPFSSDDGDDSYDETDKTIRGYSESFPPTCVHMVSSVAYMHACIIYSIM